MKIKKVTINNFRNITHAEYNLTDRNVFIGPNYTGKTNTILAIYWVLTDYMLDGTSNNETIKPLADTKQEVSVTLEMEDEWTIEKKYYEKWVKNRGTKEVSMVGNETTYYVQGDKCGVNDALRELIEKMGYDVRLKTSKFGLVRACSDPYYMALKCDWKLLRSFIIELVGDVSDDDVYVLDKMLLSVKELLTKYKHDTAKTIKHLKSHIKGAVEEIDTKQKGIDELAKLNDVEKDDLTNAQAMIDQLDNNIASYKHQLLTSVNPDVQKYENQKADAQLKLNDQLNGDQKRLSDLNSKVKEKILETEDIIESIKKQRDGLFEQKSNLLREKVRHENEISIANDALERNKKMLDAGREEYKKIKASKCESFLPLPEINTCPHCGGVLNDDYISSINSKNEEIKDNFEILKKEKLLKNADSGKALKLEIDNLTLKLKDLEAKGINFSTSDLEVKINELSNELTKKQELLNTMKESLFKEYISDETKRLRRDLNDIEVKIQEAKLVNTTAEIESKIAECKADKEQYVSVISKHNVFLETQKRIDQINKEMDVIAESQCTYENQLTLVEKFIQLKLSMLTKNVERVFGNDVKFTLVESNIKEGSWNEVCYPSIISKETAFINGSESEKIITGVYLIECIKKAMELPDLPIIFDAGSELDSKTLSERLHTDAQLIMTKVDDIHYTDVTLIEA